MEEAPQTLHMFGRVTKWRRKQLYVARNIIPMLEEQTKGCDLSKGDYLAAEKRVYIYHPFFLEYLFFFCLFQICNKLEKE
jgi:hypothetical protein